MEMYEGKSARFSMSGMPNTRREAEWRVQLIMYVYRAIMASELVSRKLGLKDVERSIRELLVEYETQLQLPWQGRPRDGNTEVQIVTPNPGMQATPISATLLCEHRAGAPDAERYAAKRHMCAFTSTQEI